MGSRNDAPNRVAGFTHVAAVIHEIINDLECKAETAARRHGDLRGHVRDDQREASRVLDRLAGARERLEGGAAMTVSSDVIPAPAQLTTLADAIRTELADAKAAAASAVEHACRAGELVIQAKEACPHGEWGKWLRENAEVSERTARAYMQLAKRCRELPPGERQRVADLPLRQALAEAEENARELGPLRGPVRPRQQQELVP